MAFTTLTEGMQSLLKLWGSIQAAAGTRLGVSGAWAAVKEAGYLSGPTGGGATIQDMNALYGLAVSGRNAATVLNSAGPGSVITSTMIGLTPNARTLAARNASPAYNIRINYSYMFAGEFDTDFITVQAPYQLDMTTTALLSTLSTILTQASTQSTPWTTLRGKTFLTILSISINAY
jgi:hypothetical protein